MADRSWRRGAKGGDDKSAEIPNLDLDTFRPPSEGGDGDAYSSATVVRAVPAELLREVSLKPAKVPKFDIPPPEPEPEPGPAPSAPEASVDEPAKSDAVEDLPSKPEAAPKLREHAESDLEPSGPPEKEPDASSPVESVAEQRRESGRLGLALLVVAAVAAASALYYLFFR
jgi:hypothetical protein